MMNTAMAILAFLEKTRLGEVKEGMILRGQVLLFQISFRLYWGCVQGRAHRYGSGRAVTLRCCHKSPTWIQHVE